MDSFELNKIIAAVLMTVLIVIGINKISDAIFMHCLPVSRGDEVTDEIIDGKQSVVWTQALNRVHVQKSIIKWCLN